MENYVSNNISDPLEMNVHGSDMNQFFGDKLIRRKIIQIIQHYKSFAACGGALNQKEFLAWAEDIRRLIAYFSELYDHAGLHEVELLDCETTGGYVGGKRTRRMAKSRRRRQTRK